MVRNVRSLTLRRIEIPTMSSGLIVIKVVLEKLEITKTFQFEPTATIADVIKLVNTKVPESVSKQNQDFGIFFLDPNDPSKR